MINLSWKHDLRKAPYHFRNTVRILCQTFIFKDYFIWLNTTVHTVAHSMIYMVGLKSHLLCTVHAVSAFNVPQAVICRFNSSFICVGHFMFLSNHPVMSLRSGKHHYISLLLIYIFRAVTTTRSRMWFIYLPTGSWHSWTLFLGKGWKIFRTECVQSFSKDGIIFSPDLCGHLLYCYQFFYIICDYWFWCIFLYRFYQCYKACHIPTPTQNSHNHLAIVSPTVIGIQNESVFCSKPQTFLKPLHARKQSFILNIQFYSYIHRQSESILFEMAAGWTSVWVCLAFPPQAGQVKDTLPTQQSLSQGPRSQYPKPVSAIMSEQGCWSRSHRLW